ncbi:phosphatase PAP2 family protein [Neobacillus sp. D3-1R]|uniref:phosphatase PAP2 family protein n=1 Tax=Neobacillus sp. D3-1R TaxID=3445778 RepID=UPI003FA12A30
MDEKIFKVLNHFSGRYPVMDFIMIFFSKKIRYFYLVILFYLLIRNKSSREVALDAIKSAGVAWLLHFVCKLIYFKPRPFLYHKVGILIPSKMDSSYFSKHTLLAFAVSTSIFLKKPRLGKLMTRLSAVTGLSRIWVGHHYPSDIIRSAVVGSTISNIVNIINRNKSDPQ